MGSSSRWRPKPDSCPKNKTSSGKRKKKFRAQISTATMTNEPLISNTCAMLGPQNDLLGPQSTIGTRNGQRHSKSVGSQDIFMKNVIFLFGVQIVSKESGQSVK